MQTIYIDHSVVSHEADWPALSDALAAGRRLVLSLWNLFEIGAGTDKAQCNMRLDFLEGFNPLWMVERRDIQKQEVARYLAIAVFRTEAQPLLSVVSSLSAVAAFASGPHTPLGLTPRVYISTLDYNALNPMKVLSPRAISVWQSTDDKVIRLRQHEVFKAWIEPSIPLFSPDGIALSKAKRQELLEYCWDKKDEFFVRCPALAVENVLTTARTRNKSRKPTESDSVDLHHAVVGLPYCDIFLSRDGYQATCAEMAKRALPKMRLAQICRRPNALLRDCSQPSAPSRE